MRPSPLLPGVGGLAAGRAARRPSGIGGRPLHGGDSDPLRADLATLARTLDTLSDATAALREEADRMAERQAVLLERIAEADALREKLRRLTKRVRRLERRVAWVG